MEQEPVSHALTEEEFENLPEIVYMPVPEENNEDGTVGVADAIETDGEEEEDDYIEAVRGDPELGTGSLHAPEDLPPLAVEAAQPTTQVGAVDSSTDRESKEPAIKVDPCHHETPSGADATVMHAKNSSESVVVTTAAWRSTARCTECSICIDDFEPGERLVVLPRCQHAFHKDCIRPWLLERQGRCPLCKTGVLQDDPDTDSDQSADVSSSSRT
jgi:hypothetical protein